MARQSYIANYLPRLFSEGHTATSALNYLRENGQRIEDKTFYRLWGEMQSQIAKNQGLSTLPLNRKPNITEVGTATRPKARGFLTQVEIAVKDRQTGEVAFHSWGYRSNQLVSLNTAIKGAVSDWMLASDNPNNQYMGQALGGYVSGVVEFVGEDDAGI